jgi:hypothetical protein
MTTKEKTWHPEFSPSYTPMQMLDLGVFEGIYTAAIKDIPGKYKNHKNVLPRGSEPNININKYGVKSRQNLPVWVKNGWTTKHSPLSWWEWYIKYFEGRRLEDEDDWQIKRWKSFVARHQGQINADSKSSNKDARLAQKQALLQWAWNWETKFTEKQLSANLSKITNVSGYKVLEVKSESSIEKLLLW